MELWHWILIASAIGVLLIRLGNRWLGNAKQTIDPVIGSSAISPGALSPVHWFYADSGDLYQESARSTLVTADGHLVGSWTNKGSASTAHPGCNGTFRGVYKANIYNGYPCVRFTQAAAQYMNDTNATANGTNAFTYFVVASNSSVSSTYTPFWLGRDTAGQCFGLATNASSQFTANTGATTIYTATAPTITLNQAFLVIMTYSGGASGTLSIYVNGAAATAATATVSVNWVSSGVQIAAMYSNTNPARWRGDIMEMGFYSSVLSADAITGISLHLKNKWGIT